MVCPVPGFRGRYCSPGWAPALTPPLHHQAGPVLGLVCTQALRSHSTGTFSPPFFSAFQHVNKEEPGMLSASVRCIPFMKTQHLATLAELFWF